jgi:hypothetical protein
MSIDGENSTLIGLRNSGVPQATNSMSNCRCTSMCVVLMLIKK